MVASGSDSLLIWGDIVHVPEIQVPRPEVTMAFDVDPAQAEATRRRVFDMVWTDKQASPGCTCTSRHAHMLRRDGGRLRHCCRRRGPRPFDAAAGPRPAGTGRGRHRPRRRPRSGRASGVASRRREPLPPRPSPPRENAAPLPVWRGGIAENAASKRAE
jgi:hypothetical protein